MLEQRLEDRTACLRAEIVVRDGARGEVRKVVQGLRQPVCHMRREMVVAEVQLGEHHALTCVWYGSYTSRAMGRMQT